MPSTGELFATDNGQDFPSFGVPDELNLIKNSGHYGWPNCYGNNKGDCKPNSIKPIALLGEHTSSDGLTFYTGSSFPSQYYNNAFVAQFGANSGDPSIGKKIVRVILTKSTTGYSAKVEDFATGFSHPISVTTGPDSCLYIADYGKGEIDRICYSP
jgi:glucose/arabinose dehydrogenase